MIHEHLPDGARYTGDLISVGVVVSTLANILPSIAALFTIVWTGIRIYETPTVQGWLGRKPSEGQSGD